MRDPRLVRAVDKMTLVPKKEAVVIFSLQTGFLRKYLLLAVWFDLCKARSEEWHPPEYIALIKEVYKECFKAGTWFNLQRKHNQRHDEFNICKINYITFINQESLSDLDVIYI